MDTSQKTESIRDLLSNATAEKIVLPEFQRDFVWELWQTYDLFDSLIRDIFIGSLIYGVPSFELTVRAIDQRPRKGDGSKRKLKLTNYTKKEINELVKTGGFRLLLDGQQRATSLCRALLGIDDVWITFRSDDELGALVAAKPLGERRLEEVLSEVTGKEDPSRLSILVSDVYKMLEQKIHREKEKAAILGASLYCKQLGIADVENSELFARYLSYSDKVQDLFKAEKLLAYYLLDTDEEKFALFFERSNSKGVQLNFIDILAAKLYAGFNLRQKVDEFKDENPNYDLNREIIVRAISLLISKNTDVGRTYILTNLTADHFSENWNHFCTLYKRSVDFLYNNKYLISQDWMPYENMLIPLMLFLKEIPHNDFSQMNKLQSDFLRFWYWASIFSERYSLAANSIIVEDTKVLRAVAQLSFDFPRTYITRFTSQIQNQADLFDVYKKGSALYKGTLNLINFASSGLKDWKNGNQLLFNSRLEDHHIFPRDYLKTSRPDLDDKAIDCVVNRTLIPKITNIKVGNKKPSSYLTELEKGNAHLDEALTTHVIPVELIKGDYDDLYEIFQEDRANTALQLITKEMAVGTRLELEMFGTRA